MFKYFEEYNFVGNKVRKEYDLDVFEIAKDFLDYCNYWGEAIDEAAFCDYLVDEVVDHMDSGDSFDNSNVDALWDLVKENL